VNPKKYKAGKRAVRTSQCSCKRFVDFLDRELHRQGLQALPSLGVQAAGFVDVARRNGHQCESTRHIAALVGIRLEVAQTRMGAALECGYVEWLMRILQKPGFGPLLIGTAYYRDLILQMLFTIRRFIANRCANNEIAAHVEKLRHLWERVDKGELAQSSPERQALIFLRKLHLLEKVAPAPSEKERTEQEAELSKLLLDAVKNEQCDFELALAKAKRFRAKRLSAPRIDEGDLRADLVFFGLLGSYFDNRLDDETLMKEFDPGRYATLQAALKRGVIDGAARQVANNIKRNWRKLLDECGVPRKRRRSGRPRMGTADEAKVPF
jgi:hypothetical protein